MRWDLVCIFAGGCVCVPHRLAGRWLVVEQQVYADADADDQIYRLSLLCSGFCREGASG